MTNSERLALLGQALYGERWQRAVARDLGKAENQVRRWASGSYEPDDDIIAALVRVAREHSDAVAEAVERCGGKLTARPRASSRAASAR